MMRGVSAAKEDVHNAIKNIDKGVFPQAFCKIIPDILGGDPEYCNIMHADGAGTKSSLAYMYWKETGDLSVWKGIAQDAVVMNTDDLLCVGAVDNILVSSTIGRNKMLVPGEVISANKNIFKVAQFADLLVIDIKDMDEFIYKQYTGKDNSFVLANLKWLVDNGYADKTIIRIPLIKNYNNKSNQIKSREILESIGFSRFDIFRYVIK